MRANSDLGYSLVSHFISSRFQCVVVQCFVATKCGVGAPMKGRRDQYCANVAMKINVRFHAIPLPFLFANLPHKHPCSVVTAEWLQGGGKTCEVGTRWVGLVVQAKLGGINVRLAGSSAQAFPPPIGGNPVMFMGESYCICDAAEGPCL